MKKAIVKLASHALKGMLIAVLFFFSVSALQAQSGNGDASELVEKILVKQYSGMTLVSSEEAVQILEAQEPVLLNQAANVATHQEKYEVEIKASYYRQLAVQMVKGGKTVAEALSITYENLVELCERTDGLVDSVDLLEETIGLFVN